ncbi:MAG: hypothetical protein IH598_09910 [Bacteroidales bacterium]|nr:hypothetical protein [Bacteroidales bacterium]
MKLRFILIFMVFLPFIPINGQDSKGPLRIELEARAEVFQLIPCGIEGVLVFYETINQTDTQNKAWFFVFYNNLLQPVWSIEIPVMMDGIFQNYYADDNQMYLAFQKTAKARSYEYNFQVISLNIIDSENISYHMFVPDRAELVRFIVDDGKLVAGFNYFKEEALIIIKSLASGEESVVKFTEQPTFIKDLQVQSNPDQVLAVLNVYISRRENATYLNSYDFSGQFLKSTTLAPGKSSEKLINAQIHLVANDELFVLGSYNNLNGKTLRSEGSEQNEQSEGFYIAYMSGGQQKYLRTHRLLDFKNITQILNNQQLVAAESLLKKQSKQGKEQSLNYDFLIHDLMVNGDEFIMLADAYYPEYRQISTMSYDFYGRPMPYYYTVFDGFRYFNGFVVSFNKDGGLNWSNGIKIWDVQTMQLSRRTAFYTDGTDMVLFYNHDGKIVSKVIEGYEDIGAVENTKIATLSSGDVQLESSQGSVSHWYGDYFLAYGYQILRSTDSGSGSRRKVFYLNKIIFN